MLLALVTATFAAENADEALVHAAERTLAGPDGCWVATGSARWATGPGHNQSRGRARFEAMFSDHTWVNYRYQEVQHDTTVEDIRLSATPIRQFGLGIGTDGLTRGGGFVGLYAWSTPRHHDPRPPTDFDTDRYEGTITVFYGDEHHRTKAWFEAGSALPSSVTVGLYRVSLTRRTMFGRLAWAGDGTGGTGMSVTFDTRGLPTSVWNQFGDATSDVDFERFERCSGDEQWPAPPATGAQLDAERDEQAIWAIIHRNRVMSGADRARFHARNHVKVGRAFLGVGALLVATAIPARDLQLRAMLLSAGSATAGTGLGNLLVAHESKRAYQAEMATAVEEANRAATRPETGVSASP